MIKTKIRHCWLKQFLQKLIRKSSFKDCGKKLINCEVCHQLFHCYAFCSIMLPVLLCFLCVFFNFCQNYFWKTFCKLLQLKIYLFWILNIGFLEIFYSRIQILQIYRSIYLTSPYSKLYSLEKRPKLLQLKYTLLAYTSLHLSALRFVNNDF